MDTFLKLPNIGKITANKLLEAGIKTEKELKIMGSEKAFLLVKEKYPKSRFDTLLALEGAVQGILPHDLPKRKRIELRIFFEMCK